jgi:hypothetical protein
VVSDEQVVTLINRALDIFELYVNRKYPEIKEAQSGEVWKKGDPLPQPQSVEEYRNFPPNQEGRFSRAIAAARRDGNS